MTKNNVNNERIEGKIKSLMTCYFQEREGLHNQYHNQVISLEELFKKIDVIAEKRFQQITQAVRRHDKERLIAVFKDMQICDFSEKDDKIFSFQCVEQIIIEVVK